MVNKRPVPGQEWVHLVSGTLPIDEKYSIEENIKSAQADIDIGPATHNRTKISTVLQKSWAFKTMWLFVCAFRELHAELLITSKTLTIENIQELKNIKETNFVPIQRIPHWYHGEQQVCHLV